MRKTYLIALLLEVILSGYVQAQKSSRNILKSTNIGEIEEYLRTAHPEDPKRSVLKPKLIALKNEEWTKGRKEAKPMEARPVVPDISGRIAGDPREVEEFKRLIAETSSEHKDKTVHLLNKMFDQDLSNKEAILLVKNNSDCNLIIRILGNKLYNLPIPAGAETFIVIDKGFYKLTGNVCNAPYASQKEIKNNIFITINNPEDPKNKNNGFK